MMFSRMLFPSAFGLNMMVSIVMQGLTLLSDVGIQQAVIQNPKGDEQKFLNTAWTMQVVRSVFLALLCAALAYPAALLYREPLLGPLLLVGAFQLLLFGFHSTSLYTLRRRVASGLLVLLEIGAQIVGMVVTAVWAVFDRSVWALAMGAAAATRPSSWPAISCPSATATGSAGTGRSATRSSASAAGSWLPARCSSSPARPTACCSGGSWARRCWVSTPSPCSSARRWAWSVTASPPACCTRSSAAWARATCPSSRLIYYRTRLRMDVLLLPGLGVLAVFGDEIVKLLWDPRYEGAGWMLRILVVRVALGCLFTPCETCLTAIGNPRYGFLRNLAKAVAAVIGIPLGFKLAGLPGLLWAASLVELASALVLWPRFRALGLLRPVRELLAVGLFLGGFGLAWAVGRLLGLN